jgi:uncharacterized protein (DUF983 family)
MNFKDSRLYSIIYMKCPRCHEGDFFVSKPYDLKNAGNIHENCSCCDLKYSKEPGFYYGAMYVSYGLSVALFVAMWVSFNIFFSNIHVGIQIASVIVATIVLAPYFYALSKIIWINLFVKYDRINQSKGTD